MKILYFHQHFSTPKGSAGTRSYEMAKRLVESGHAVTIVCGSYAQGKTGLVQDFVSGRRHGNVDGIDVVEFDLSYSNADGFLKRSWTFLKFAWRSIWIALKQDADIVFATTTPLTAALPGIAAKWLRGRRFVFEVRDLWPELPKAMGVITNPIVLWMMAVLEWTAYKSADRLIGLSPGIVDGIAKHGIDRDKIAMIPNGCDVELFSTPATKWRPSGVEDGDFMAIFAGTHGIANGLDAVVDASAILKEHKVQGIKIVLVGDGKEKPRLQERVAKEGLDNYVIFHPPVPKQSLVGLMQSADLGLQILANVPAFYYGTSPNKFFDYIAADLPVLTNYPGWVADLIKEHGSGYSVEPENPREFAEKLIALAKDKNSSEAYTQNNNNTLLNIFSRDKLYEKIEKALIQ